VGKNRNKKKLIPNKITDKKSSHRQRNIVLFVVFSIILIAGLSQIVYAISGGYIQEYSRIFPMWKQYQVGFTTVNLPGVFAAHQQYILGFGIVRGDLTLTSKLFSVNNEIDANLILIPELKETKRIEKNIIAEDVPFESSTLIVSDEYVFQSFLDILPQNFFVIFLGAENVENISKTNDRFAIIEMNRNMNTSQYEGTGTIEYDLSDNRKILFLDPSQLEEFMSLRKEFTSDTIQFNLDTIEIPEFTIPPGKDALKINSTESYALLIDGKSTDYINIDTEEAISDLFLKNLAYASPGFLIISIMITLIVTFAIKFSK